MANEFNERAKVEQERQLRNNIQVILNSIGDLTNKVVELKKEVRSTREELRNLDKLRPLKKTEETVEAPEVAEQK